MQVKNFEFQVFTVNKTGKFGIEYTLDFVQKYLFGSSSFRRLKIRSRAGARPACVPARMELRAGGRIELRAELRSEQPAMG